VAEPDARREWLLALARGAARLAEPMRRHAVADLIHERFRQEVDEVLRRDPAHIACCVEEIILAVYPATDRYWNAWLYGPQPHDVLANRLAEATAISEVDLERRRRSLPYTESLPHRRSRCAGS